VHVEQRLAGQQRQSDAALVSFLTATLEPRDSALLVTFRIDSVPEYVTGVPGLATTTQADGITYQGTLAPDGTIHALTGRDSTVRLPTELGEQLRRFYPRIPLGGISSGQRWTDTLHTSAVGSGVPVSMTAVSEHVVAPPVTVLATQALPIRTSTVYTLTGNGTQAGQPFTVQGTGQRHTVELVGLDGTFLGLVAADTSWFTLAIEGSGLSIPGQQTRADTVSVVP
jgi:hypothetical protein